MPDSPVPAISVVIPFRNEEARLPACLQALESQTIPSREFEVILIDNASTDGSRRIAERFPNGIVLHERLPDPYLARNRGIAAARGEYVVFLDADCIPDPGWLETLRGEMVRTAAAIILGYLAYPEPCPGMLRRYQEYYDAKLSFLQEERMSGSMFGHAGNMAVRRSVFDELGFFLPMPIVGDTEIIHRVLRHWPDAAIVYTPAASVIHSEVVRFRDCLTKLYECGVYSAALAHTSEYQTLPLKTRWRIFQRAAGDHRYGLRTTVEAALALLAGLVSFQLGRARSGGQHGDRSRAIPMAKSRKAPQIAASNMSEE